MSLPLAPAGADSSALDEETARAEVYGLLAALYYAPPSSELLAQLRVAVTEAPAAGGFLEEPWRALVGSARALSDEAIQTEYDDLFGGVGKPEIFLYGSHYLSGFLNEKPLIKLRDDLAELGLARDEAMSETEDHLGRGDVRRHRRPSQGPLQRRPGRFHPRLPQRGGAGLRSARFLTKMGCSQGGMVIGCYALRSLCRQRVACRKRAMPLPWASACWQRRLNLCRLNIKSIAHHDQLTLG